MKLMRTADPKNPNRNWM